MATIIRIFRYIFHLGAFYLSIGISLILIYDAVILEQEIPILVKVLYGLFCGVFLDNYFRITLKEVLNDIKGK